MNACPSNSTLLGVCASVTGSMEDAAVHQELTEKPKKEVLLQISSPLFIHFTIKPMGPSA